MKEYLKFFAKKSFFIILIFGLISLFGDMIYEGARSINGQYLLLLGATVSTIGFFSGFSEFISNFLRFLFGFITDKTKNYWLFIFLGYFLLIFVPLMALTNSWQLAVLFILFERIGKAIRNPARDAIVSIISKKSKKMGFYFGIIEFLDQIGALLGPIIIATLFIFLKCEELLKYKIAYSILFIPFIVLIFVLFFGYYLFRKNLKIKTKLLKKEKRISKIFWLYIIFSFFTFLGFINFLILGYHFKFQKIFADQEIVLLYSLAMIIDAIFAIIIGKIYDKTKNKLTLLFIIPLLNTFIPILIFSYNYFLILMAIIFYGIVLGTQETIMRAFVAEISPISKRGSAYGIFSFFLGLSMFLGSWIIGFLYETSLFYLILFIIISQILSILILNLINIYKNKGVKW